MPAKLASAERLKVLEAQKVDQTEPNLGADGLFNFRTVPPGEYRLTTLVDPEPGIWYDREVLETLDSSSIRIVIAEGEKKVEHVKIR
jgi:hypothetical protein